MPSFFGPYTPFNEEHAFALLCTQRYLIPSARLSGSLDKIKVSLAHFSTPYTLAEVWIGQAAPAGDPYDFDGNQAQLFFSGNPSVTVSSPGTLSDICVVDLSDASNIIVGIDWGAAQAVPRLTTESGFTLYYKGGVHEAGQTDVSGYSSWSYGANLCFIQEILTGYVYKLSGTVKAAGVSVERTVRSYIRSTGALFDSALSNPDGSFELNAPDDTTLMFIIAFDLDGEGNNYNALIYDKVTGIVS